MTPHVKLLLKARKFTEAKAELTSTGSNAPRTLFYKAFCRFKLAEYHDCMATLKDVLAQKPDYQAALLLQSLAAIENKNFQLAYRAMKKLVKLRPVEKLKSQLTRLQKRYLIIDDQAELLDTSKLQYKEFQSDYNQIRFYTFMLMQHLPDSLYDDQLFMQQVGEIMKNAIRHGNRGVINKRVKVWFEVSDRVHLVFEDEGKGFTNLDDWNSFNHERMQAFETGDFERASELLNYRHGDSQADDGGNALVAALNYWDEGLLYNSNKNRVAVVRKF